MVIFNYLARKYVPISLKQHLKEPDVSELHSCGKLVQIARILEALQER